jgi:hypothetical protein
LLRSNYLPSGLTGAFWQVLLRRRTGDCAPSEAGGFFGGCFENRVVGFGRVVTRVTGLTQDTEGGDARRAAISNSCGFDWRLVAFMQVAVLWLQQKELDL